MSQLVPVPAALLNFAGSGTISMHGGPASLDGFSEAILWALPLGKLLFNLSAAAVVGALVMAATALAPGQREYGRALKFAGFSAAVWTVVSIGTMLLAYLDAAGGVTSGDPFGSEFGLFLTSVRLGQTWLTTTVISAVVATLCLLVRRPASVGAVALLSIVGLVPLTLNGHPNYGEGHEAGMAAYGLHIMAAALWLGGLITLVVLRPNLPSDRLPFVIRRYSALALFAFIVLAASGYLRAQASLGTLDRLTSTTFGFLIMVKVAALVILGILGFVQRRRTIARIEQNPEGESRPFWALVSAELLLMGLASGVAPLLAEVDRPVPDVPVTYGTLAEKMADQPLPAPPGPWNYFAEFRFDPIWFLLVTAGVVFYLAGARRLRSGGCRWPLRRTFYWLSGMVMLLYLTNRGLNVYRDFLFSAHVLAQISLTALAPVLLVAGRPVALASATVQPRDDGSWGVREWINAIVRSPPARALAHPYAAAGVLAASLLILYFSPVLRWVVQDSIGHQIMVGSSLVVGALFVHSLRSSGPEPAKQSRAARFAVLAATMLFTSLGLFLLMSPQPLLTEWYGTMGRPWGVDPIADQRLAGIYALAVGAVQVGVLLTPRMMGRKPLFDTAVDRDEDKSLTKPRNEQETTDVRNYK